MSGKIASPVTRCHPSDLGVLRNLHHFPASFEHLLPDIGRKALQSLRYTMASFHGALEHRIILPDGSLGNLLVRFGVNGGHDFLECLEKQAEIEVQGLDLDDPKQHAELPDQMRPSVDFVDRIADQPEAFGHGEFQAFGARQRFAISNAPQPKPGFINPAHDVGVNYRGQAGSEPVHEQDEIARRPSILTGFENFIADMRSQLDRLRRRRAPFSDLEHRQRLEKLGMRFGRQDVVVKRPIFAEKARHAAQRPHPDVEAVILFLDQRPLIQAIPRFEHARDVDLTQIQPEPGLGDRNFAKGGAFTLLVGLLDLGQLTLQILDWVDPLSSSRILQEHVNICV